MSVTVRWDNYAEGADQAGEETEYEGTSMQITYAELRNENGDVVAHFDRGLDRWVRLSDMTAWTDIAW